MGPSPAPAAAAAQRVTRCAVRRKAERHGVAPNPMYPFGFPPGSPGPTPGPGCPVIPPP